MRLFLCLLLLPFASLAEEAPEPNYVFRAELVRVIDGNTVAMNIDLGFGVWVHNQTLTLLDAGGAGLDETAKAQDMKRVAKLRELFQDSEDIVVRTVRDRESTPPRYLAVIWADETNLNQALAEAFP